MGMGGARDREEGEGDGNSNATHEGFSLGVRVHSTRPRRASLTRLREG